MQTRTKPSVSRIWIFEALGPLATELVSPEALSSHSYSLNACITTHMFQAATGRGKMLLVTIGSCPATISHMEVGALSVA